MARTTYVKKAQQRYETRPVLDADGHPVKIALTNKDGSPKMTRAKGSRPLDVDAYSDAAIEIISEAMGNCPV